MRWPKHIRRWLAAAAAALSLVGAGTAPVQAAETITTPQILAQTLTAMPSCLSYEVKGMCFFLHCSWRGCRIRSSIRIAHYVPDVIVSTYHDPLMHPWLEVGKPLAASMGLVGSAIMGMPVDSSADTTRPSQEMATFKSVDAIGNPAGMILTTLTSGQLPNLPDLFGIPGYEELMKFPRDELPNIQRQWMSVPIDAANNVLAGAAKLALAPAELLGKLYALPGQLAKLQTAIGNVGQIVGGAMDLAKLGIGVADLAGVDLGPLQTVADIAGVATGGMPLGSLFCPGSASAFTLHFQSDLDSPFWRDLIPLELLYPASWIPLRSEVSTNAITHTWGSKYPRNGNLVQAHPVKASAVYAERVASIITKKAQPHIYKPLKAGTGFKYFGIYTNTKWQMLAPRNSGCQSFGSNDSLSLTSFGDGRTSSTQGYVWNMWNKYDCCQSRGSYLFSVP